MSDLTNETVSKALEAVVDPGTGKNLVESNMLDNLTACDGNVKVDLIFPDTGYEHKDAILAETKSVIQQLPDVKLVTVGISLQTKPKNAPFQRPTDKPVAPIAAKQLLPNVKNIVAVSSGKGGVGKTSVSVNLACALTQLGYSVGIVDADIYGPNVALMMGLRGKPRLESDENGKPLPPVNYDVKVVSMSYFLPEEQPVVWRGPMLDKTIRQFLNDFQWGELDFLLVDLPPGTGDAQLTIMQAAELAGAIVVTTPQEVALHDSRKALNMFKNQNIPLLGIVENMSYFLCDHGGRYEIFGNGGGRDAAEKLDIPFLGEVPLVADQRKYADLGQPVAVFDPNGEQAAIFRSIAENVVKSLAAANEAARKEPAAAQ